jgi:hypothetical protein
VDDHYDVQAKREAFLRETRVVTYGIAAVLGAIAAALLVVGLLHSPSRALLGVALGLVAFFVVRAFRGGTQAPGQGLVAWALPLLAIVGTVVLASLPDEWDGLGWGFFAGVGIAAVAQVVRMRRLLATDDELFIEAEARGFDAASPFDALRGR